jgi:hypothetical protein
VRRQLGIVALLALALASVAAAAPQPPTLGADPQIGFRTVLFGTVAGARANEEVAIEAKWCGAPSYVVVERSRTNASGAFHVDRLVDLRTSFRARANGAVSAPVTVQTRPGVRFEHEGGRRFNVWIVAFRFFDGKRGRFERFDNARRRWVLVKRVTVRGQNNPGRYAQTGARFTAAVKVGWLVRFVLPLDQARPCYLAGYSLLVRVQ